MAERFRVLVLADSRSFHTERFVAELKRQGVEVRLASLEAGEIEHVRLSRRGPVSTVAYRAAVGRVRKLVAEFAPDCISAHYAAGYGYLAAHLKRNRPPVLLHVWGSDVLVVPKKSFLHKRKVVSALKGADAIVADSAYLAEATEVLGAVQRPRVFAWGIEERHLGLHKSSYEPGQPLRVIVPRLHEPVYNNFFIVKALAEFIRDKQIEVTFPAFGSRYEDFRRRARKAVGGRVRYYEKLSRRDFLELMASHDVFLSAAKSDSSPVSLIESMALGLIPVVADIPGVREWLTEDSGIRFRQDDATELQAVFHELVTARDPHEAMRRRNLEKVKQEGIFEKNVAGQVEMMKELAERGRAG